MKWEYKVAEYKPQMAGLFNPPEFQEILNHLGAEGWELASVLYEAVGDDSSYRLFLKRASP